MMQDNGASSKASILSAERDAASLEGINWPVLSYAPGSYSGLCDGCGEQVMNLDKRARSCLKCAIERLVDYAEQAERSLRIKVWNEAKLRGLSDRGAMDEIAKAVANVRAQAMEARQGRDAE